MKIYAGIGSRETPPDVCQAMCNIAMFLSVRGWTLRSGHADGADKAFELGATHRQIFLPWAGFNGRQPDGVRYIVPEVTPTMIDIAARHHPAWHRCSGPAKKLHIRNVCQVLGLDCNTPADMVICWTRDGKGGGGTGQAIRIAKSYNIPIFDIALEQGQNALCAFLDQREAA